MPPTDRACCSALAHWTHLARGHGVGARSRVLCTSQTPQTIAPGVEPGGRLSVEPKACLHGPMSGGGLFRSIQKHAASKSIVPLRLCSTIPSRSPRAKVPRGLVTFAPRVCRSTRPHDKRDTILLQPVCFSVGLLRGLGPCARARTAQRLARLEVFSGRDRHF